ncbi:uncharacterized protein BDV14DRAFT_209679 [Aspergillus stella-maris]|uniref:uncharacterized protein n=1 Tax=Aspergillus stella-maris TaxID=1810926 RepID=UPI003CCD13FD
MVATLSSLLPRPDRKRRDQKPRILFSCTLCRERKLKCDRGHPCLNCKKRQLDSFCRYIRTGPYDNRCLENITTNTNKQLLPASGKKRNASSIPAATEHQTPEPVSASGTQFVHPNHWRAIMIDAAEDLGSDQSDVDRKPSKGHIHLLTGLGREIEMEDLLVSLPPRDVADRLVSLCLGSKEPALIIIHGPTFQAQYCQFMKCPAAFSSAWLSLLYGVLACGAWIEHATNLHTANSELPNSFHTFREGCAVALSKSGLTSPGAFKVEAAMLCLGLDYLHCNGAKAGLSILVGVVVRLAIMMGYHDSPRLCLPALSVFETEMRRRAWLVLSVIDSSVALETGLPKAIYPGLAKAPRPRNIRDEDLNPDIRNVPPPRASTDIPTGIDHMIALDELCAVATEIAEYTARATTVSYTDNETVYLEQKLEAVKNNLPSSLHTMPQKSEETDSDLRIIQRDLEMIYQRSRCILHRQHLTAHPAGSKPQCTRSHLQCVDAARRVLEQQALLFQEVLYCPRNRNRTWFGASRSVSDCLTAAMVICLEISNRSKTRPSTFALHAPASEYTSADLIQVLDHTYTSLKQTPRPTVEIKRAAETGTNSSAILADNSSNSDSDLQQYNGTQASVADQISINEETHRAESKFASQPLSMGTADVPAGSTWLAFDDLFSSNNVLESFDWVSS